MTEHWILDGHEPKAVGLMEWARWYETADRRVALDTVGEVRVSTVFLGIDHGWTPGGPPILFETMVFGGDEDDYTERYATWDEAAAGHARKVAALSGIADRAAGPDTSGGRNG